MYLLSTCIEKLSVNLLIELYLNNSIFVAYYKIQSGMDIKIYFDDVSVGYNIQEPVLEHVSFTVQQGELVYLIGKTAAGKSSLIKTMYAEIPPLAGKVLVADYDMNEIKKSKIPFLRRKVSVIFQDFQLLPDRNVHENLLFVLKATGWTKPIEMQERINEVLTQVGLFDKEYKMLHQLSGGEQQRVVIARALLNKPEIILADEPTGNLDPDSSDEIFKLLHSIAQSGCAMFVVTHNYQLVKKYTGRTLQCTNNTITEIFEQEHAIDFGALME